MKKLIILILLFSRVCFGAVTNLAELKAFAAAGGSDTIAPGTYTLDANLAFNVACVLTHSGAAGNAIIDGDGSFDVRAQDDGTRTFVGTDNTHRIVFQNPDDGSFVILGTALNGAGAIYNFTYCNFTTSAATRAGLEIIVAGSSASCTINMDNCLVYGNVANGIDIVSAGDPVAMTLTDTDCYDNGVDGLVVSGAVEIVNITATDCDFYSNNGDNVGLKSSQLTYQNKITLNNCISYDADDDGSGSTDGDGVTAHHKNDTIIINGGSLYSNGLAGIANIDGSTIIATGVEIYNNGVQDTSRANVWELDGNIVLMDCDIHYSNGGTVSNPLIELKGGSLIMEESTLDMTYMTATYGIELFEGEVDDNFPAVVYFSQNSFTNAPSSKYVMTALTDDSRGWVANNVFYGNANAIDLGNHGLMFRNNIFHQAAGDAFECIDKDYSNNPLSDYNSFYGQSAESDYFTNDSVGYATNDIDSDPMMVDPANEDFSVSLDSACLNAGYTSSSSFFGNSTIGLWDDDIGVDIISIDGSAQAAKDLKSEYDKN